MDRQAAGMTWAEGEVSPEVELIWVSRYVSEISLEVWWCYQRLRRFDLHPWWAELIWMDRQAAGMTWAEGKVSREVELIWVSRQVAEISLEVRWCYQRLRRFDLSLEVFYRERAHDTSPED